MQYCVPLLLNQTSRKLALGQIVISLFFTLIAVIPAKAQNQDTFRRYLSRIRINVSSGVGGFLHKERIYGDHVFQHDKHLYAFSLKEDHFVYLIRPFDSNAVRLDGYRFFTESKKDQSVSKLQLQGKGVVVPIILGSHVDWKKLRVGFNGALLLRQSPSLSVEEGEEEHSIKEHAPQNKFSYDLQLFGSVGFKVFEYLSYAALFDFGGGANLSCSTQGNNRLRAPDLTFGIGLQLEKAISENTSVFGRLSGSIQENQQDVSDADEANVTVSYNQITVLCQIGISMSLPEHPECPIPNCHTRVKHRHSGKVYRGTGK